MGSLFKDVMTLADLYHYPTQHFEFHQRQLTLGLPASEIPARREATPLFHVWDIRATC